MYKLIRSPYDGVIRTVTRQEGNMLLSIPHNPANSDFQQFKLDLADGIELQDADGNTMSPEEVAEFLATLP